MIFWLLEYISFQRFLQLFMPSNKKKWFFNQKLARENLTLKEIKFIRQIITNETQWCAENGRIRRSNKSDLL